MKTLVFGATGNTCSILVPKLLDAGHKVRAFVRNEEKAKGLEEAGAEIFVGDLDRPETIDPAFRNIDKVYLCLWNGPTAASQGLNVINAIKRTDSRPFVVRHSAFGSKDSRIIKQIDDVDQALKELGLPWISIKPTFYMQNLLMAAPSIQADGRIFWDWDEGKAGMIDIRDVADSAFGALTGQGQEGKEYILTGPEAISMYEVAAAFSKVLGKEVNYIPVPHTASKEAMMGLGFPEFIVDGYMELNEGFAHGYADISNQNVKILSGHQARSIRNFIDDFKEYFVKKELV
jgi:uncharacterized protein YbjT (DUF2867 family)